MVKIRDILNRELVVCDAHAEGKEEIMMAIASHVAQDKRISLSAELVKSALLERESLGSTGVGEGVAIPHAKLPGLQSLIACFMRVPAGVPFNAIDQKPVHLLFTLLVPENSAGVHLKALARTSRLLRDATFRKQLLTWSTSDEIYQGLLAQDEKE